MAAIFLVPKILGMFSIEEPNANGLEHMSFLKKEKKKSMDICSIIITAGKKIGELAQLEDIHFIKERIIPII